MTNVQAEFERATDFAISDADIERARRLVGVEAGDTNHEQITTASYDSIRNFARSYGDDNPLYVDEHHGQHTRWGSQIAPPMIHIAMSKPLQSNPIDSSLKRPSFRGIHVFVSGTSCEFYRPIHPGDTLYMFGGNESVEVKTSEFAGRSVLVTFRRVRMNQKGEVVTIERLLAIHTERKTAREKGKYAHLQPATYTDEQLAEIDAIYAAEERRGAEPRFWEDVEIGETMGKMAKGPITTTDIIVFHAGGYGFTPYTPCTSRIAYKNRQRIAPFYVKDQQGIPDVAQRVHWDNAWAQAIGNPMAYDYGQLRDSWISHFLTDWMGDDGWLLRMRTEIRKFNYLGDAHILTGEVVDKRIESDRRVVDVELRGTNQRGDVTCPATATIALPSRDHGPVVLPPPPTEVSATATRMLKRHWELQRDQLATPAP